MARDYQRQSALAHLHLHTRAGAGPPDAALTLCERPYRAQLLLRGNVADADFVAAVAQVLGVGLPQEPNTSAGADGWNAL